MAITMELRNAHGQRVSILNGSMQNRQSSPSSPDQTLPQGQFSSPSGSPNLQPQQRRSSSFGISKHYSHSNGSISPKSTTTTTSNMNMNSNNDDHRSSRFSPLRSPRLSNASRPKPHPIQHLQSQSSSSSSSSSSSLRSMFSNTSLNSQHSSISSESSTSSSISSGNPISICSSSGQSPSISRTFSELGCSLAKTHLTSQSYGPNAAAQTSSTAPPLQPRRSRLSAASPISSSSTSALDIANTSSSTQPYPSYSNSDCTSSTPSSSLVSADQSHSTSTSTRQDPLLLTGRGLLAHSAATTSVSSSIPNHHSSISVSRSSDIASPSAAAESATSPVSTNARSSSSWNSAHQQESQQQQQLQAAHLDASASLARLHQLNPRRPSLQQPVISSSSSSIPTLSAHLDRETLQARSTSNTLPPISTLTSTLRGGGSGGGQTQGGGPNVHFSKLQDACRNSTSSQQNRSDAATTTRSMNFDPSAAPPPLLDPNVAAALAAAQSQADALYNAQAAGLDGNMFANAGGAYGLPVNSSQQMMVGDFAQGLPPMQSMQMPFPITQQPLSTEQLQSPTLAANIQQAQLLHSQQQYAAAVNQQRRQSIQSQFHQLPQSSRRASLMEQALSMSPVSASPPTLLNGMGYQPMPMNPSQMMPMAQPQQQMLPMYAGGIPASLALLSDQNLALNNELDFSVPPLTTSTSLATDTTTSSRSPVLGAKPVSATNGKKKYPCPFASKYRCTDTFTTSGHAARHAKKHTGEKNVHCPTCDKAFTRKDNMKQHLRTHAKHKSIGGASEMSSSSNNNVKRGSVDLSADARDGKIKSEDGRRSWSSTSPSRSISGEGENASPDQDEEDQDPDGLAHSPSETTEPLTLSDSMLIDPAPQMHVPLQGQYKSELPTWSGNYMLDTDRPLLERGFSGESRDADGDSPGLDALALAAEITSV